MASGRQKYEVFIESVEGSADHEALLTNWSWHRLDERGDVVLRGARHPSLEACFASAQRHSRAFGGLPVRINLH